MEGDTLRLKTLFASRAKRAGPRSKSCAPSAAHYRIARRWR